MSTQAKLIVLGLFLLAWHMSSNDGGNVSPFGPSTGEVSVLIVEETADRPLLPASQLAILNSTELRAWAKTHCDKDASGNPEFRVIDKDADVSHMSQKWQDRIAIAKTKPLPYLAVSTGKSGAEGDLPLKLEETMPVLRRYTGD